MAAAIPHASDRRRQQIRLTSAFPDSPVGGPPDPSDYRYLGGMEYDSRIYFLGVIRDPEKLPQVLAEMQARFQKARDAAK
jgi:hypothetical protein